MTDERHPHANSSNTEQFSNHLFKGSAKHHNMGLRKRLLGEPTPEELEQVLKEGATVVDIRTPEEFASGHVPGALHIPLDDLLQALPMIPRGRPVVTCNADDALSATAAEILNAHGFKAYDGGGWTRLSAMIPTK